MALREDREIYQDTIKYTCDVVAERGSTLVVSTAGSGVALGESAGVATLASNPSGYKVAGMLLGDVVSVDETRYHRNFHKDEQKTGERVRLLRHGVVTTDKLHAGYSPTDGSTAYLTSSGTLRSSADASGGIVATPKVGEFKGLKDESGFICVEVNLPIV